MEQTDDRATATGTSNFGAGLCLLSLDGGGIRGISSLLILQRLMEMINPDDPPKPCDYFDMIGGTSTGGLIAVMLGRLRMSVQEAYDAYMKLSPKIFSKQRHRLNWKLKTQGRYSSEAIVEGVVEILKNKKLDADELLKDTSPKACKTFVCTTSKDTSEIVVLSSHYSKRRGRSMRDKAKLWEAVRATSAASSFFDPIIIDGLEFVDGATGANNPLHEMWTEATDTFKTGSNWTLEHNIQCLVSIGTGRPTFKPFIEDPLEVVGTLTAIATDTEKVWENFNRQYSNIVKDHRFFRFNVDRGLEGVELDETKSISTIRAATDHYLQVEKVLDELTECGGNLAKREKLSRDHVPSICAVAYEIIVVQTVISLAQKCVRPDLHAVQGFPTADSESLWQNLRNTVAYDQWICPSEQHSKESADGTESLFHLLIYNSVRTSDVFPVSPKDIGLALAVHLSSAESKAGRVIYSRCDLESYLHGRRAYDTTLNFADVTDAVTRAMRATLAQLTCCDPIKPKLDYSWTKDSFLCSTLSDINSPLSDLLRCIERICGFIEESVTVVLSLGGEILDEPFGPAIKSITRDFATALDSLRSRNTWRILLEGPLYSDLFPTVDTDTEHQDCLSSLAFEEIDFYIERIPPAWPGTNQWLWTHDNLQDWLQAESGILWIQGKPGSGKSVLARTIVERGRSIPSQARTVEKLWVSAHRWIYSRRFEDVYSNHSFMLRSLLFQILEYDKKAFRHVRDFWRENRHAISVRTPQISELQQMLRMIARNLETVLLFVIDGFDEGEVAPTSHPGLEATGREEILLFITELVSECSLLKFIILSRPETDIERILSEHADCYTIVLQHENDGDIRTLIDGQLAALESSLRASTSAKITLPTGLPKPGGGRQSARVAKLIRKGKKYNEESAMSDLESLKTPTDRIREYLATHAQGVFLWVKVIFKELQDLTLQGLVSWNEIETAIKGLPTDLIEMYEDISKDLASRHSPGAMKKAQRALEWVFVASTLDGDFTLQVLRDALSIPSVDDAPTVQSMTDPFEAFQSLFDETWSDYRRSLYQLCGPFIDVVRPKDEDPESFGPFDSIQLIHTTARDFLATPRAGKLQYSMNDSCRRVENEVDLYLRLSFPATRTRYCPLPAEDRSFWETIVDDVLDYVEGKPLVAFALRAFPGSRESLPEWTSDLGHAALPPSMLEAETSHDETFQRETLLEYAHAFYPRTDSFGWQMGLPRTGEQDAMASAIIGKLFCDGCMMGSLTAVENLTALISKQSERLVGQVHSILNGTLIAAICQRRRVYTIRLTSGNRHIPGTGQIGDDTIEAATPFLDLALQYSDVQVFDALYERAGGVGPVPANESPPGYDVPVKSAKSSWMAKRAKAPDPLHMLAQRPRFNIANEELAARSIALVVGKYLSSAAGRWKKAYFILKIMFRFLGGHRHFRHYRERQSVADFRHNPSMDTEDMLATFRARIEATHDVHELHLSSRVAQRWKKAFFMLRVVNCLGHKERRSRRRSYNDTLSDIDYSVTVDTGYKQAPRRLHAFMVGKHASKAMHRWKKLFFTLRVVICLRDGSRHFRQRAAGKELASAEHSTTIHTEHDLGRPPVRQAIREQVESHLAAIRSIRAGSASSAALAFVMGALAAYWAQTWLTNVRTTWSEETR